MFGAGSVEDKSPSGAHNFIIYYCPANDDDNVISLLAARPSSPRQTQTLFTATSPPSLTVMILFGKERLYKE